MLQVFDRILENSCCVDVNVALPDKLESIPIRAEPSEVGLTVTCTFGLLSENWLRLLMLFDLIGKDQHANGSEHTSFYLWSFLKLGESLSGISSSFPSPSGCVTLLGLGVI